MYFVKDVGNIWGMSMSVDKVKEAFELFSEEWKPRQGENHPIYEDVFRAGWEAAIEAMLNRMELMK